MKVAVLGAGAIGAYVGAALHRAGADVHLVARATNEMNCVAQKFARVGMGTNNVDSCNRTCHAPSVAGLSAAFGSGGGTSSYEEIEHTDVIVMRGSHARFAHPVFFQHVLKGIRNGGRLYAVDPRRTSTAAWAESRLGLNVGTGIPPAHAIGREIIRAGPADEPFIARATTGFEEYRALCVEVCPTGALSPKTEFDMRAAGTWDGSRQTETATVCAYCGVGCTLTLHVQDNEIVKVTSPHDDPVTHGNLCSKGRFGYQHVQNRG